MAAHEDLEIKIAHLEKQIFKMNKAKYQEDLKTCKSVILKHKFPGKLFEDIFGLGSHTKNVFDVIDKYYKVFSQSKAQLKQDIFVLLETDFKQNGYFVEFGATNGVDLSNTYLLEKEYNWKGILAEPAKIWQQDLCKNRSAHIDFGCVWNKSNEILSFNMTDMAEFSTIASFSDRDKHARKRQSGESYDVKTISLNDLLKKYEAPTKIDYLSIDTEGSEFEILRDFDFDTYDVAIITCEHNHTEDRKKIYDLLVSKGYMRTLEGYSKWDDWYINYDKVRIERQDI